MSRAKPKLTIKQLTQNMEVMTSRIDQFLNMFVQELEKHNTLIAKMLEADGKMHLQDCPSCGGTVRTPLLEGIEQVLECPYCQASLHQDETTQSTLPLQEEE